MSTRHRAYGHARRRALSVAAHDAAVTTGLERRRISVASGCVPAATTDHPAVATPAGAAPAATAVMATDPSMVAGHRGATTGPERWWVLDPSDDASCVRELLELHGLEAGRVVCHPRPGATWPVLVEDLLRTLGKHPQALSRERRTHDGPSLLQLWLRAEGVRHLIVLRADRLRPAVLDELLALAHECTLWLVWHRHEPPPTPHPRIDWTVAAAVLHADAAAWPTPAGRGGYSEAFQAARVEARGWRPDAHRLGPTVPYWERARPGCDLGALLQRLTIDAADPADLRGRLQGAQDGLAVESRRLTLPELDGDDLAALGPRLPPATIARLRQLACPATAAGLMLGLVTDAQAPFLAHEHAAGYSNLEQITLLSGDYRVPERARTILRGAILNHEAAGPGQSLLARPGTGPTSPQRFAYLVRRGAALAGVDPPAAARPLYGINPATPFAAAIATRCAVT